MLIVATLKLSCLDMSYIFYCIHQMFVFKGRQLNRRAADFGLDMCCCEKITFVILARQYQHSRFFQMPDLYLYNKHLCYLIRKNSHDYFMYLRAYLPTERIVVVAKCEMRWIRFTVSSPSPYILFALAKQPAASFGHVSMHFSPISHYFNGKQR